ncbi:cytochrome C biogenesis protein ResA [Thermus scotoductus]|uniref:Cytochrome C biogenesis protein ResA n=1 Tax=Thermus scotoductus TaxID=37636 RepID=A0A430RCL9_THESC|nr:MULTISPECIES: cytochrome c [Thermus]ETN88314.1 cytochrome C biogenesis protein ResA [Thermus sp. NMX2.A1]RTG95066.1 cytochrome C biogenesis protein ResA [Thermus scotoductus]RTG97825.1 cytochrome C biogenesis protein ResA [Thermus scotoductus]RTH05124.1 cytochrome C biogenesis protein ResA [Thermus scotoductus]RTH06011.1 cytochrome C biogenesis protein ResA [Thermus scotoductus]
MRLALLLLLLGTMALGQGEDPWKRLCAQCHGERAQGVRPYPGLQGAAPLFATPEGRRYLVLVILYGKKGEGGLMPGFAQLKDEELAALLNHLKVLLQAKGDPFTPEEIRKGRGLNLTPDAVKRPEKP